MKLARGSLAAILAILVPLALIGLAVRLLLTPTYLQLEYRLPGFPPDDYGFSTAERLKWGTFGMNYVIQDLPPAYLGSLKFDDQRAVFEEREVRHMQDVQRLVLGVLRLWYATLALMAILGIVAWRAGLMRSFRKGLRIGGWAMLAAAGLAALLGTVGASGNGDLFWNFFSAFHGLFFSGDSWLFAYSDTLIRLYPLRFWQDTVLYIGILTAAAGAALAFGLRDPHSGPAAPP